MNFVSQIVWSFVLLFLMACQSDPNKDYKAIKGKESCLNCHQGMTGFSAYHNPEQIGCASCHLGNTQSPDKDTAHQGMILLPGNFSNVAQTCATANCHFSEWERVSKSLMTTNSGIIRVDKLLFEDLHHPDSLYQMAHLGNSASDVHLQNLCANCHLGKEKTHYAVTEEISRGGGCLACHVNYHEAKPNIKDNIHPTIDVKVGSDKCFGCHSRSGRISLSYEGWYELDINADTKAQKIKELWKSIGTTSQSFPTMTEIKKVNQTLSGYRVLQDGRVLAKASSDVHHQAGMACIDCHISQEIMGDGHSHQHQHEALKIHCSDCHFSGKPIVKGKLETTAIKNYALRHYKHSLESVLFTQKDSIAIVNTYLGKDNKPYLVTKNSKKTLPITTTCQKDAVHSQVSCSMCHTAWAPTCIGCHTEYDDTYVNKNETKGRWREHIAEFSAVPPTIAVRKSKDKKEFVPAIPGMVMTLNQSNFNGTKKGANEKFVRWYAPNAAHTTTTEVRNCKSCHTNPQALGFGKGDLKVNGSGKKATWHFTPYYAKSPQDFLPQDAWIGFLSDVKANGKYSAHQNFLPLNLQEQRKMLEVGACLQCHADPIFEKRMISGEYATMFRNKTQNCIVPK